MWDRAVEGDYQTHALQVHRARQMAAAAAEGAVVQECPEMQGCRVLIRVGLE